MMDVYLDRRLSAPESDEVEGHLHRCDACRRHWGDLVTLLTDPEPVQVPEGLCDRILASVQARLAESPSCTGRAAGRRQPRRPLRWLRYAGGMAACLLFFITGWLVSGWWMASGPAKIESITTSGRPQPVNVVVSPWILSSWAQAAAVPGPVSPVVVLAQGVIPELMIAEPIEDEPMIRIYRRPPNVSATQPAAPGASPEMQLLPLVPSYLGA